MCFNKDLEGILSHYRTAPATEECEATYDYGIVGAIEEYLDSLNINYNSDAVCLGDYRYLVFFSWNGTPAPTTLALFCEMEPSSYGNM